MKGEGYLIHIRERERKENWKENKKREREVKGEVFSCQNRVCFHSQLFYENNELCFITSCRHSLFYCNSVTHTHTQYFILCIFRRKHINGLQANILTELTETFNSKIVGTHQEAVQKITIHIFQSNSWSCTEIS